MNKISFLLSFIFVLGFTTIGNAQSKMLEEAEAEYQKRILLEEINEVYIPKDIYDAFKELDRLIVPEGREKFKAMTEQQAEFNLHFSLGGWIRNNWGLWDGSRFSAYLAKMDLKNPDYMSRFVIVCYHRKLNGKELGVENLIPKYRAEWAEDLERRKAKGNQ